MEIEIGERLQMVLNGLTLTLAIYVVGNLILRFTET